MVALMCDCCKDGSTVISDFSYSYSLTTPVYLDIPVQDLNHYGYNGHYLYYYLPVTFGFSSKGIFRPIHMYNLTFSSYSGDFLGRDRLPPLQPVNEVNHIPFDGSTQFVNSSIYFYISNLLPEHLSAIHSHIRSFSTEVNSLLDDYINFLRGLPEYPDIPTGYSGHLYNLVRPYFLDNPRVIYNFSVNVRVCVHTDKKGLFKSFEILSFEIKDL